MAFRGRSPLLRCFVAIFACRSAAAYRAEQLDRGLAERSCQDESIKSCRDCVRAVPEKKSIGQYFGLASKRRCVWKHRNEADLPFLNTSSRRDAIWIIEQDREKWCPLVAVAVQHWKYDAEEAFECVEEGKELDLKAFSAARPAKKSLPKGADKDKVAQAACERTLASKESLLRACREDNFMGNKFVDVRACQQYRKLLADAFAESGELEVDLWIRQVKDVVDLAEQRYKRRPAAIPPSDSPSGGSSGSSASAASLGTKLLCQEFGHRYIDQDGLIFKEIPDGMRVRYPLRRQAAAIEDEYKAKWVHAVAVQARTNLCSAWHAGGEAELCERMRSGFLCQAWLLCICSSRDTSEPQEIFAESAIEDLAWHGGGKAWEWRNPGDVTYWNKRVRSQELSGGGREAAAIVEIQEDTGRIFLADGHHRLMAARDFSTTKRAWAVTTCTKSKE